MTTTNTSRSLNELTTEVTAFASWTQFEAAMSGGYVPTLRPWGGRARSTKLFNEAVAELRARLVAMGYQVF